MKIKCNDRRFAYRFVGKDAEEFARVTVENLRETSPKFGEDVKQRGELVEIVSNDYLLHQVQERVRENVPVEANGFYVLHLLSCNYVFKGYRSEQCAKEVAELANKHKGVFADANNSVVRVSVNNGDEEALHDSIYESIRVVLGDEYEWR